MVVEGLQGTESFLFDLQVQILMILRSVMLHCSSEHVPCKPLVAGS